MELQTVILYGRSGSGKGTQGELLKEYIETNDPEHRVLYIETGKGLRTLTGQDVHTGRLTKAILDEGGLLPVFLPVWVWTDALIENFTGHEHMIFDGIARRLIESPVIDDALQFYGRKNTAVVHIDISREQAIARLKARGRYDDNDDDIKARLDWYDTHVIPAIDYFRNKERFRFFDINGEGSVEEVHKAIMRALGLLI